jgi:hypothetical protein
VSLERQKLLALAKELRQVAISVSVVGSRRWRLLQFTARLRPIRDELTWTRPEIGKLRGTLSRAIHNMERSREDGRQAKNMRSAADALDGINKLMGRALIPRDLQVGKRRVLNVWGYTARELMPVIRRLEKVSDQLEDIGLNDLVEIEVVMNPEESPNDYAIYAPSEDAIFLNPKKSGKADRDLLEAFGDRMWVKEFDTGDRKTWGSGTSGWTRFTKAWVAALDGKSPDADTTARLAVTVGQRVGLSRWTKSVA